MKKNLFSVFSFLFVLSVFAGEKFTIFPGNVISVEKASAEKKITVSGKETNAKVILTLPGNIPGGKYIPSVQWLTGGRMNVKFVFQTDMEEIGGKFKNKASWKEDTAVFTKALTILPGQKEITFRIEGKTQANKVISSIILEQRSATPALTPEQSGIRQNALKKGTGSILLLEGKTASDADILFTKNQGGTGEYRYGEEAEKTAKTLNLRKLPAVIRMNQDHVITQVIDTDGSYMPEYQTGKAEFIPLKGKHPVSWLTAGTWGGVGGLALLGIDQEKRIMPQLDDAVPTMSFDHFRQQYWTANVRDEKDGYVICRKDEKRLIGTWGGGTWYSFLYVKSPKDQDVRFIVKQSGSRTSVFLNGQILSGKKISKTGKKKMLEGITDQGNAFLVAADTGGSIFEFILPFKQGLNTLLVKYNSWQPKTEDVTFDTGFLSGSGLETSLTHPDISDGAHKTLLRLRESIQISAPANLTHPGEPLTLTTELIPAVGRGYPTEETDPEPYLPFEAKIVQSITDMDGKILQTKNFNMTIPGKASCDFGKAGTMGYYGIQTDVYGKNGKLISHLRPDGFSVIGGVAARRERQKAGTLKMATSFYWLNEKSCPKIFDWMEKIGLFHNVGSGIGFRKGVWDEAKKRGLTMSADFIDPWCNDKLEFKQKIASGPAEYGAKWYKAYNEIDIHPHRPSAEKWTARMKLEYELVKAANPDALYTGGSLVRVATNDWFENCLKLGMDQYIDVWDVHAYPKDAPTFESKFMSNSETEDAQGVESVYRKMGKTNTKDFIMGETGARCCHGFDSRRWQANMVAKQAAWITSRRNWHMIAFLIPWQKSDDGGDIAVAHYPAEAALYTAGALIDGMPYSRMTEFPAPEQGGLFGETRMLWTKGKKAIRPLKLDPAKAWVQVDVVGRVKDIAPDKNGIYSVELTNSPKYILPKAEYQRLIR